MGQANTEHLELTPVDTVEVIGHDPATRLRLVLPALVVSSFLFAGWQRRFLYDDAFINFRVVKQIQAGNGPVLNVGERVEVATSTLWLAVLTVADVLAPIRIEYLTIALCLALGALGLVAGMAGALRLARLGGSTDTGWVVPLGALAYLGISGSWDWATGGLENGLSLAWIGTCFYALTGLFGEHPPSRGQLGRSAALVGLGVLVRPDFAFFSMAFAAPVAVVAWRRGQARTLAAVAAAALALPISMQIFRMGYYGQLLPNTVYAKEGSRAWWAQGWEYLMNFVGPYALMVPMAATALLIITLRPVHAVDRSRARDWLLVVAAVEAAALLHMVSIVRTGGDYSHARLLLPAWFALLLPIFAVPSNLLRVARRAGTAAVLVAWAAISIIWFAPPRGSLPTDSRSDATWPGIVDATASGKAAGANRPLLAEGFRGAKVGKGMARPEKQGLYAFGEDGLPVHPDIGHGAVAANALGAVSYTAPLDVWVHDRLGLGDPVTARVRTDRRSVPGHEKTLPAPWTAAAWVHPDTPVDVSSTFAKVTPLTRAIVAVDLPEYDDPEQFAVERQLATEALECGPLAELRHNTRAPLTPQRFLGNMVDAVRLHNFRFSPDPATAHQELCG